MRSDSPSYIFILETRTKRKMKILLELHSKYAIHSEGALISQLNYQRLLDKQGLFLHLNIVYCTYRSGAGLTSWHFESPAIFFLLSGGSRRPTAGSPGSRLLPVSRAS